MSFLLISSTIVSKEILPNAPGFLYEGRASFLNDEKVEYDWSGFSISFTVRSNESSQLKLLFDDGNNWFNVAVNGEPFPLIKTVSNTKEYTISGLPQGDNHIVLTKRFESYWGTGEFLGIQIGDNDQLLTCEPRKSVRIGCIGDSYVAGYGVESSSREGDPKEYGSVNPCTFYTNTEKAFGRIVADAFDAEPMITAYSGKGLVRNSGGADEGDWFLSYYSQALVSPNTIGGDQVLWDHSTWTADLVIIHLGINDFSGEEAPPADTIEWNWKYHELIDSVRSHYEHVKIILMATNDWPHSLLQDQVKKVVTEEREQGFNHTYYYEYSIAATGLHWHPNESEQQEIANGLIKLIEENSLLEKLSSPIVTLSNPADNFSVQSIPGLIQLTVPISGEHTIAIQSLSGRVIQESVHSLDQNVTQMISTDGIASGVYIVSLHGVSGYFSTKVNIYNLSKDRSN